MRSIDAEVYNMKTVPNIPCAIEMCTFAEIPWHNRNQLPEFVVSGPFEALLSLLQSGKLIHVSDKFYVMLHEIFETHKDSNKWIGRGYWAGSQLDYTTY